MHIEERLASLDASLKTIVTILQSASSFARPDLDAAAAVSESVPVFIEKPAVADVVDGDPAGTVYFVDAKNEAVYAQTPDLPAPTVDTLKQTTAKKYLKAKEAFAAKKLVALPVAQPTVAAAALVAALATPVLTASLPGSTVEWKHVISKIMALDSSSLPGCGRECLNALLAAFGCAGKRVPSLEALGQHAEILAYLEDKLNPAQDPTDIFN